MKYIATKNQIQNDYVKALSDITNTGETTVMNIFISHTLDNIMLDEFKDFGATPVNKLLQHSLRPDTHDVKPLYSILNTKTILTLIKRLHATYRKVMCLRYIHGLKIAEISVLLSQSKNATTVQLHRGFSMIKSIYKREFQLK